MGALMNKIEPIKLYLLAEFETASSVDEARKRLDAFRESVMPSANYGITLFEDPDRCSA
jgi:hypothetical protein